ncbi:MAG TPA: helix-turn-helix domain-containing protein [Atopostipes sp.]|nr:helix-turn-helix domain-containing protein [Atopostipes sp.]
MITSGERIRLLRTQRDKSQIELANDLGYKTYTTVSKWEADKTLPPANELKKLAIYFEVSTDYLLGLEDVPTDYSSDDITTTVKVNVFDSLEDLPLNNSGFNLNRDDFPQIEVPQYVLTEPSENYFVTRVRTDSFNRMMNNGDNIVILDFRQIDEGSLETGDILLIKINDGHRILYYRKTDSMIYLEPYSHLKGFETFVYTPEQFKEIEILGKIVYVFRKFD